MVRAWRSRDSRCLPLLSLEPARERRGARPRRRAQPAGGDACVDATALRTAVDDLKAIDLTSVGTDGLTAAVDDVQAAGTALKSSVAADLTPEVTALETALTGLGTAVEAIGDEGEVGAAAADIQTAVAAVDTAASALVTDVQSGC